MLQGTAEQLIPEQSHRPRHAKPDQLAILPVGDAAGRSYEDLYVEHAPVARAVALSMVPRDVADDIVAEAFTRVLGAIRAGGGPGVAFRAYLLTAVRNTANDWLRASRRTTAVGRRRTGPGRPGARGEPGPGPAVPWPGGRGRGPRRGPAGGQGVRQAARALAGGAVAAGGGDQGAGRRRPGVRPVGQRGVGPGRAGPGGPAPGLPGRARGREHPRGLPGLRRGAERRHPGPAEPSPPGRRARPPGPVRQLPLAGRRADRAERQARRHPRPSRAGRGAGGPRPRACCTSAPATRSRRVRPRRVRPRRGQVMPPRPRRARARRRPPGPRAGWGPRPV